MHAKSVIIVQIFEVECAKGRSSREKPRSGEYMCAALKREIDFESKRALNPSGVGANAINLEKHNV